MQARRSISIMIMLALPTAVCFGQMSTFPPPPNLAPSADPSPDAAKSAASGSTTDPSAPADAPTDATKTPGAPGDNSTSDSTSPAAVSASTLTSMDALDDKVTLEAGDTVSFRVIEDRDPAVSKVVTDTGEVDFPYIGRVKVEGKTCHQVALQVKQLLEVDYYKHATVIVGLDLILGKDKEKAKDMAWVVGEVHDVGPQVLLKVQPMTVSEIILKAGGFGEFADQTRVKVIHRGGAKGGDSGVAAPDLTNPRDTQVVNVKAVFDGHSTFDPVVEPNDYIIVPKKLFNY